MIDQVIARRLAEHRADAQRVARELHGDLDFLRAERARAARVVASLDEQIAAIEQMAGVMAGLAPLHDGEFAPRPPSSKVDDDGAVPQQRPSTGEAAVPAAVLAQEGAAGRGTYRDLVLPLLAQDPSRWWKAREIAEALGVSKLGSLREALRGMAGRGLLEYETDDLYGSRYRAVQPAAEGVVSA